MRTVTVPKELTNRQAQVYLLIADGRTTREIAETLGIGIRGVESHVARIKKALGLDSRPMRAILAHALRR